DAPRTGGGLMPTLSGPDGTQLVYDAFEPAQPRAAVLVLHGWSDHAGRWREAGERLCDAGLAAYLLDLRGHGRSGGRRGHLSRFSQLLGDLQAFRRGVRLRTAGPHDAYRIECPLLFLLAGEDRIVDSHLARAFADGLKGTVQVRWYPDMYHEVLHDPQRDRVMGDILAFVAEQVPSGYLIAR